MNIININLAIGSALTYSMGNHLPMEALISSFDKLRKNGKCLIPFVVSLSDH
jgi:hypothetical protein